ncbi:IS3 family transposase [Acinetobacter sp. ANC 4862]|jgi:putative transposase|uniref:IS3 family transposase n=1 Tax=Acinetobacter sp. ANC 4862 TaxID=2529849 RepID=UPI00103FF9AB|nr:hypothetical protein E0409_08655 [Acinetobacter sp. ANC 4862]
MSCRGLGLAQYTAKERIKKRIYKTQEMACADVFDYIEMFYNPIRRHSHLDGMSPKAFETSSK